MIFGLLTKPTTNDSITVYVAPVHPKGTSESKVSQWPNCTYCKKWFKGHFWQKPWVQSRDPGLYRPNTQQFSFQ